MPLSTTALADIDGSYANFEVLAGEISRRLQDGREQEVFDFLRQCDESVLSLLGYASNNLAWETDPALWLSLARLTVPRGVLLREPWHAVRQRDEAFSRELCELAEQYLAGTGARKDALVFVMRGMIDRLAYPGIPRRRVFNLLEWNLALSRAAGYTDEQGCNSVRDLVDTLDDTADLIALSGTAERYFETALHVFKDRAQSGDLRTRWLPWQEFFRQHPEYIDRHHNALDDPGLILQRWEAASPKLREDMIGSLLMMMRRHEGADQEYVAETVDRLIRSDEAFIGTVLRERHYHCSLATATLIWTRQYPVLVSMLLPLMMASRDSVGQYRELVPEVLSSRPDLMLTAVPANLDQLIPLLGADLLRSVLPEVGTLIGKSASKALREAIAGAGKTLAIADIVQAGWLNVRNKNLRLACKDLLIAHPDQSSASPLLAAMLAAGQLDAATASSVEAHLAQGTPGAAPDTGEAALARLETQAAGIKRWSATIKPLDNPETLAMFQPLSEHAARAALHLAATGEDGLPPLAGALLAHLPAEARARLALHLVALWIGSEGNPKLRFVLQLAVKGADDRIVDLLSETVFSWAKTRKQRAVIAVEQLARIDTLYALARVLEIAESKKVRGMIPEAALDALKAAAARRKLALAELLDELTPDFGLGQGIALTVGDASYRIVLQGDLSLRLVDANGKVSKTLPANKDDATREAWEIASNQFKTASASLKAVGKLQGPRMLAALVTAKTWSAARWTALFLDHPLLKIMGRSLIWQTQGTSAASFRIAEDFSLLHANDEVCHLPPDAQVALWHPATARAGETEAWRSHFADYQLTPLIDQTGAPARLPPAAAMSGERLLAPAGLTVPQEHYAAIATQCGYRPGPVGDGPSIDWREWQLPAAGLEVRLENGLCSPYMNLGTPVEVHGIEVRRMGGGCKLVAPASLPKALLATLWSHLQLLDAKRTQ
ncbi:DUF4132 domain-containing protein [Massilia sp. CCM 8734]|uniref:DUF4132 domain-containing protein n=1 Tax=Massilia sp. CCM 8734 TaxID=2609283 RepID=UPI00141E9EDC|nr:DUF4132 domain-containing protein [Massilia sp. CCM 8734]